MLLPPGPSWPSLLQTAAIVSRPIPFLTRCFQRYGDAFTLRVLGPGSPPVVFLSHPEALQQIFASATDDLEFGKVTYVFRPLVGQESLIMQQGDRHRRQRQILMPALHGQHLHSYGETIQAIATGVTRSWQVDQTLAIRPLMADISLEVILRVVFGLQPGPRYRQLQGYLADLLEAITGALYSVQFFAPLLQQNLGPWSPWGRFVRRRAAIDELLYAEIAERRQGDLSRSDVLSLLLTAKDGDGEPLSDQELRDQLMTLLLLGHETTASSLAWAFYWIHQDSAVRDRLLAELAPLGPQPDPMALQRLPYLNALCQETLRLYPIALISQPRRVCHRVSLGPYCFEPGTILVPCIYTAHRRLEAYPEPLSFRPERFLQQPPSPYEFLPFGGGSRSCIGSALSLYEMKVVLATVLQRYRLRLDYDQPLRPQRRGITFVPPEQVRFTITALSRSCRPS
ncbi:MAG: cytochrome P450 [Cyanobacteria bacterium P01_A01_bin.135]